MDSWCYKKLANPKGSFQYTFQEFVHKSLGNGRVTSGSLAAGCHIGVASTYPASAKRIAVPFPEERGSALPFPGERGSALPFPGDRNLGLPFPGENGPAVYPLRLHILEESICSQGASLKLLVPIFQKPFLENGSKAGPLTKEPSVTKA